MIPRRFSSFFRPIKKYYLPYLHKPKPKPEPKRVISEFIDKNDIVVEIGARIGGSTLLLASICKYVYSFEPNPYSFKLLQSYTKGLTNVQIFNFGIADTNDFLSLNITKDDITGAASFRKMWTEHYVKTVQVNVRRLDDIKFEQKPTSLVLDCEGYEVEALQGAKNLLDSVKKVLVEWHEVNKNYVTHDKVISLLKDFEIIEKDYIIGIKKL